jgi:L-lactate dehydrogenase complex protein LldE
MVTMSPMRIALFVTCLNDVLFPQTPKAATRLLRKLGHEVTFPAAQTCCGQMHLNTGYRDQAAVLCRNWVRAFGDAEVVAGMSGSCVAMVREQFPALAAASADKGLARDVDEVAARTYDLSELLIDVLGVTDVGAGFPHRVTYHPACHSLRSLHLGDKPYRLLRAVRGLELIDLPDETSCCGFGGTFAVKNAATSAAMLTDKLDRIRATGADYVVAADNSCLMHIGGGLSRRDLPVRPIHLAEVLAS